MARRRAVVVMLLVLLAACRSVSRFERYFLDPCPADGPVRETEMGIVAEPLDVVGYERDLAILSADLPRRSRRLVHGERAYTIWQIGPLRAIGAPRVLVVAGIHGNEVAAALAAPALLTDLRTQPDAYGPVELHVVAPANPVGLAHLSRYEANGCDPNRDFGRWRTSEARVVADAFDGVRPALVVAFHEGPQDGFYVVATGGASEALATAAVRGAEATGIALARHGFLGASLAVPGLRVEGWPTRLAKRAIELGSLGVYAAEHGVGTLTTESPWREVDQAARIRAHVAALRAVTWTIADRGKGNPDGL